MSVTTPAPATFDYAKLNADSTQFIPGATATVGTPIEATISALSDSNYEMKFKTAIMNFSMESDGTTTTTMWLYSATQVNFQKALTGSNVMQQWFSPKIASSGTDVYTNFICQYTNAGAYKNQAWSSVDDITVSKASSAAAGTFAGSQVTVGNEVKMQSNYEAASGDNLGWYSMNCGSGIILDRDIAGLNKLNVGDTVNYKAGFKLKQGAVATANLEASTALTDDLSFTIMESGAIALSVTAAALVAMSAF